MTEKDRIDDLYDIAVLDRALYREEFRRQVESHQPPIRERLEKLREKREDRNYTYIREYNAVGEFIKDLDILLSKDKDGDLIVK